MRNAARIVITRVFPVPAPARMSSGPSVVRTACSCSGLRSKSEKPDMKSAHRMPPPGARASARSEKFRAPFSACFRRVRLDASFDSDPPAFYARAHERSLTPRFLDPARGVSGGRRAFCREARILERRRACDGWWHQDSRAHWQQHHRFALQPSPRQNLPALNSDMRLRVQQERDLRFYYPDAMIVCRESSSEHWQDEPVVIFEVLSENTERIDHGEKRSAYLTIPTLDAYVLVDSRKIEVLVYHRAGADWRTEALREPSETLLLETVECALPLAEIYEGTGLFVRLNVRLRASRILAVIASRIARQLPGRACARRPGCARGVPRACRSGKSAPALRDDLAAVHARIDVMHGAAGFRRARGERLFPRFEAGKGGQQGRVDIDDAARERLEQRRLDHPHAAGEHDEFDARLREAAPRRAPRLRVRASS